MSAPEHPVSWGVLGAARIALERVVPPIAGSRLARLRGIASRDLQRAEAAAGRLGIERAYGSYEDLLADPDIEAVYIPLPNTLHVDWTLRAIAAGKHVLCEKPLALTAQDVDRIGAAAEQAGVKVMEGFMLFSHPRWSAARDLVQGGAIGTLGAVHMSFSNPNLDPANIRNRPETAGGAFYDKGCYAVALARYLFGAEPVAIAATQEADPAFGIDRLTAGLLRFPGGIATFDCASQLAAHQVLVAAGTKGRLEVPLPVTPPDDRETVLLAYAGEDPLARPREIAFPPCNQYRLMIDAFSRALREGGDLPVSLGFSRGNATVLQSIAAAARGTPHGVGSSPMPGGYDGTQTTSCNQAPVDCVRRPSDDQEFR